MWFIFPQFTGLGFSETSKRFAIKSLEEGRAFMQHPTLGSRLIECAQAVLMNDGRTALQVFGSPDDQKLHSSATLFAYISPSNSVFEQILVEFFSGKRDERTISLLSAQDSI